MSSEDSYCILFNMLEIERRTKSLIEIPESEQKFFSLSCSSGVSSRPRRAASFLRSIHSIGVLDISADSVVV